MRVTGTGFDSCVTVTRWMMMWWSADMKDCHEALRNKTNCDIFLVVSVAGDGGYGNVKDDVVGIKTVKK